MSWFCELLGWLQRRFCLPVIENTEGDDLLPITTLHADGDVSTATPWENVVPVGPFYVAMGEGSGMTTYVETFIPDAGFRVTLEDSAVIPTRMDITLDGMLWDPSEKNAIIRLWLAVTGLAESVILSDWNYPASLSQPGGYIDFSGMDFGGYGVAGRATKMWPGRINVSGDPEGGIAVSALEMYFAFIDPGAA